MSELLLPISARSELALRELARSYATLLLARPTRAADVCIAAALGRDHHPHRLAVAGADAAALAEALSAWLDGDPGSARLFAGRRPRAGLSLTLAVAPSGPWVQPMWQALRAVVPALTPELGVTGGDHLLAAAITAWSALGLEAEVVEIAAAAASSSRSGPLCVLAPAPKITGAPGSGPIMLGGRDSNELFVAIARLYSVGVHVRWRRLWSVPAPRVDLPRYPWQRGSYWFDRSPLADG